MQKEKLRCVGRLPGHHETQKDGGGERGQECERKGRNPADQSPGEAATCPARDVRVVAKQIRTRKHRGGEKGGGDTTKKTTFCGSKTNRPPGRGKKAVQAPLRYGGIKDWGPSGESRSNLYCPKIPVEGEAKKKENGGKEPRRKSGEKDEGRKSGVRSKRGKGQNLQSRKNKSVENLERDWGGFKKKVLRDKVGNGGYLGWRVFHGKLPR